MEDKLAEFLVRSQAKGGQVDGAWMRSFDFKDWDYYGSATDTGWGPWSVESGWTMTWITTSLALRQKNTTLWQVLGTIKFRKNVVLSACEQMIGRFYPGSCT